MSIDMTQFTRGQLAEFKAQAEHAHSWGSRCLAVESTTLISEGGV